MKKQYYFTIDTHMPTTLDGRPFLSWKTRNTPFARTTYTKVDDAMTAVKQFDPTATFISDAIERDTKIRFILYAGCKGTFLIIRQVEDPNVIPALMKPYMG